MGKNFANKGNKSKGGKGKGKGAPKPTTNRSDKKAVAKRVSAKKESRVRKPKPNASRVLKSSNINDLQAELVRIDEINQRRPTSDMKNKEKRRELVFMRNSMKKKVKSKIRRKKQTMREELGDEAEELPKVKTIDNQRENEESYVDREGDEELKGEVQNDEYTSYFNKEYDPQVLITTSIKHTGAIFKFMRELKETIPNSFFYYRKKVPLKEIVEMAKEKGFTDIIVVYERLRKPYRLILSHLPDGPTCEFKITNVVYHDEIEECAKNTGFSPELIFKNFDTKIGFRLSRILNSLFPHTPQIEGRQVVTFHNQRDYIFFRHHRFIFNEDFNKVNLQEIGPRFCLRLLSIQKGTFDNLFGEYEWYYKNKMGVRRRKFFL
jgi:ribosome production factor 1